MKKFKYSEITSEKIYNKRRSFIRSMGYGLGTIALSSVTLINANANNSNEPTSYEDITTYNNETTFQWSYILMPNVDIWKYWVNNVKDKSYNEMIELHLNQNLK